MAIWREGRAISTIKEYYAPKCDLVYPSDYFLGIHATRLLFSLTSDLYFACLTLAANKDSIVKYCCSDRTTRKIFIQRKILNIEAGSSSRHSKNWDCFGTLQWN